MEFRRVPIGDIEIDVPNEAADEVERLRAALRRRDEPPTDERLAKLLARSQRQPSSRPWRIVGYLVRCVQRAEAERDEARAAVDAVRALHGKYERGDWCLHCGGDVVWPCDTIEALDAAVRP